MRTGDLGNPGRGVIAVVTLGLYLLNIDGLSGPRALELKHRHDRSLRLMGRSGTLAQATEATPELGRDGALIPAGNDRDLNDASCRADIEHGEGQVDVCPLVLALAWYRLPAIAPHRDVPA